MTKYSEFKRTSLKAAANLNKGLGIPDAPLCLYLEVSNLCNFKCAFCASFSAINPKRMSMLKQSERGFFDLSKSANIDNLLERALTVYLFGFGEPTIHPDFEEIIRHVGSFETQIEFVTNGMHLTEKLSKTLVESRVRQVMISFSGSTKSDYENMYLNGNFETVLDNIATLDRIKRENDSPYPVILINSIAFKHHIESLPLFVDLMGSRGAAVINVNNLVVNGAFPEMFHHAAVYSPDRDGPIIEETKRRAKVYGIELGLEGYLGQPATTPLEEIDILQRRSVGVLPREIQRVDLAGIAEFANSVKAERPTGEERIIPKVSASRELAQEEMRISAVDGSKPVYCMEPFRVAYIKRDGNVMPCCLWSETTQSFGDVSSMSASEIWNSHAFNITRESILDQKAYPSGCQFCVKARIAPEDAQLWQATSFISWYRTSFGVDLSDSFDSGPFKSARDIQNNLRGALSRRDS